MQSDQADRRAGKDENVQGEEATEGRARDVGATEYHRSQPVTRQGNPIDDGRTNAEAPVGVGIPTHDLTRKREPERGDAQGDAGHPGQFPRELVGPVQENLRHVNQHHDAHGVRTPAVKGSEHPSHRDLLVDIDQALIRLGGTRHEQGRQQDPGHQLHDEEHQRGATEDVPPLRAPRHLVEHRVLGDRDQTSPVVDPPQRFSDDP